MIVTSRNVGVAGLALGVTVLALGVAATLAPTAATAATSGGVGRYTAIAATRILDTRNGTGGVSGPVASGTSVTVTLPSSVPSGASAVAVNLTSTDTTGVGNVRAYTGSTRPTVSNLNYAKGTTVANLAVVRLDSSHTITLYNEGSSADLIVDVAGYVSPGAAAPGSSEALGGIATTTPTRVLDTRNGTGAAKGQVPARSALNLKVTGSLVPADASAVLVNLTALSSAPGYVSAYPTGVATPATSNLNLYANSTVPGLALVPVGSLGSITLYNGSTRPIDLIADLQGYLAGGSPVTTGAAGSLVPQRLLDTRTTGQPLGADGTTTVKVLGTGGVPITGVSNVVVTVTAVSATGVGNLAVYPTGTPRPATSNLNYVAGRDVANSVVVAPGSDGTITVANTEDRPSGQVQVLVDVAGYVRGTDLTVPSTTRSRYLADLTTDTASNQTTMSADGCADAKLSPTLVLLDVGAQSRHAPLSSANPGVALARTSAVRLSYAQLRSALASYVSGFDGCRTSSAAVRIAIGTNSDGNFHDTSDPTNPPYAASQRGADWANDVIDQLVAPSGITFVGASDIEAGFAGTEADDENWITGFLGATTAGFVYNGSLDACGDSYSPAQTFACQSAPNDVGGTNSFTPAQYVRLTYALAPGRISVLPQIYYSVADQAAQWRNLYLASGNALTFEGSLTQYAVCGSVTCGFTGAQGWSALQHALSTVVSNPSLPVATDLVTGGTGGGVAPLVRTAFHGD